jgi:hypothetical protein
MLIPQPVVSSFPLLTINNLIYIDAQLYNNLVSDIAYIFNTIVILLQIY